jgi:DNA-binding LacI/PurR family transcriptional regulator
MALRRNLLITPGYTADESPEQDPSNQVAGTLILFNYDNAFVQSQVDQGLPVVLIDPRTKVHGVPYVTTDHFGNLHEATLYLARRGHERILHVTVDQHLHAPQVVTPPHVANYIVEERVRGYATAMATLGRSDHIQVFRSPGSAWDRSSESEFMDIVNREKITACCCFNDDVALRVLRTCQRYGLNVPEDMNIVGHDDLGVPTRAHPSLTSMRVPLEELGQTAVRMLDDMIEQDRTFGQGVVFAAQLNERGSTGANASNGHGKRNN